MKVEIDRRSRSRPLLEHAKGGSASPSAAKPPAQPGAKAQAPDVTSKGPSYKARPVFRAIVLAGLAGFLVWEVATRSIAAYLAETSPQSALLLRSTQPTALLNLADESLSANEAARAIGPTLPPVRSEEPPERPTTEAGVSPAGGEAPQTEIDVGPAGTQTGETTEGVSPADEDAAQTQAANTEEDDVGVAGEAPAQPQTADASDVGGEAAAQTEAPGIEENASESGEQTAHTQTSDAEEDTGLADDEAPATQGSQPGSVPLDGGDSAQIEAWAERALLNDPINPRALRILGQLAHAASDEGRTDVFMQAAAQRSLHESSAVYWMMRKSCLDGNYRAALRYADILLRTRSQATRHVVPVLGKMAEIPGASADLKDFLAKNPPWRSQFFAMLPRGVSDARTPLDLFLSLRSSKAPPTAENLRSYLDFLIGRGFHELAYYAWLQFLPPEQLGRVGRLFNGDFETTPSGLPFDWVILEGTGTAIEVASLPDQPGQSALRLEFGPGRVSFREVKQQVLLTPGTYIFKGKVQADLMSERGLQWLVTCVRVRKPIGASLTVNGSTGGWQDFEFSFSVPETGCPAQVVLLALDARSASEMFVSGSIWYDDLSITRDPTFDRSPG